MDILTSVGGAILSVSFQALFDKLGSTDLVNYGREGDAMDEFKKWEMMLKRIYLVLDDAEEKQMVNPLVKVWVSKIRDLAFDMEDILDEFSTDQAVRRKLEDRPLASTNMVRKFIPTCCARLNLSTLKFNAQIISKIKSITSRLDEVMKQKDDLVLGEGTGRKVNHVRERPPTTSLVNEEHIYGRVKDKEAIIQLLKAEANRTKLSIIPIVGMGGIGKTTLAQLIFNDSTLEFDFRSWVSVGEDFDVQRMTKSILQLDGGHSEDLNSLQLQLKEKLSMKTFLIVLDDVWTENYDEWTRLCAPFIVGACGSTLIITTRSHDVASMMGTSPAYPLKELTYDDCMLVFAQHALGATNFDENMDLKDLGARIVDRCQGLPLAAKALGGLLRGKSDPYAWEEVLASEMWDLSDEKSNILPALRLSYFHLPSHLKQCFAYCAVFPKGYEFDMNELVLLWMAGGFLYQSNKMKQLEDLGHQYVRDLLSRSFFQQSSCNKSRYVMHDLMNDLARHVSIEICFQLGDELEDEQLCGMIRQSSFICHELDTWQKFEVFLQMKRLRTFLAMPTLTSRWLHCYLSSKVLYELVPELKWLRVLSLAGYRFVELPSTIGALKLLRYLNLSHTQIKRLPESVIDLLNLQTLKLCGCDELTELPFGIGKLGNLYCLDISGCEKLRKLPVGISNLSNLKSLYVSHIDEMPPQIGNLRNLRTLTKFIVGKDRGLKLTELRKLPKLQGKLCIGELQNVVDIRDADFALLKEKIGIEELELEWSYSSYGSRNPSDDMGILNSLRPHQNLSSLSIRYFGGIAFPSWVGDPAFNKMVKLNLWDCRNITSLPPLGQLSSLKELRIWGMDRVKEVGVELYGDGSCFASLDTLSIEFMKEWKQWFCSEDLNEEAIVRFPKLRDLRVIDCPKLVGKLPSRLPSLQKLFVEECQEALLRSMSAFTSLTSLEISTIFGLESLDEAHIEDMMVLEDLKIKYCDELMYMWKDGTDLYKLTYLKSLEILSCNQMVSLLESEEGQLPCNLQVLSIENCDDFEKLSNGLHQLTCLRDLKMCFCHKIKSFPATGVPYGLRHLEIYDCNSLESMPEGIIMSNGNQLSQLEELKITGCPSLTSAPNGEFPILLKSLSIEDCNWPTQLFMSLCTTLLASPNASSRLTKLEIGNCPQLEFFPETGLTIHILTSLSIYSCQNLKSLPNYMQNLTSLQSLKIEDCGGLESFPEGGLPLNLNCFWIDKCKNLKQPMSDWGLHRLTNLTSLTIKGRNQSTEMFDSFPDNDGILLPTSLVLLCISNFKNLKSISAGLLNLTSLTNVGIEGCPNLCFFPEEGFPPTLGKLSIENCPFVKEWCLRHRRDPRSIIFHIPLVEIDRKKY